MADGVDHIDIYADVGEEFNQVGEGLGLGSAADADGAAAWTLIGVTAGREPGSAADREPGASGPRRCVCGVPLTPCSRASFLRAVERGAGPLCSRRRPPARSSLPQGGLTSHCWLRWRALPAELGRVCGAGRTGPPRPLPRRPPDGGGGEALLAGRAPVRRLLHPGPAARVPIPPVAPFCVFLSAHGRPHGRPHSQPFVSRAPGLLGSLARVGDRFRCGARGPAPRRGGLGGLGLQQVI